VVTPLTLADGRVVLVNRGWTAGGATRADLPLVPPSPGSVTVQGRVNIPSAGYLELQRDTVAGPVWQNLDPQRFAQATGVAVLPVVIEQTAPIDGADALVREWPAPDLGIEKHRIYMFQWYAFATMAVGFWVYFTWRRPK